MRTNRIGLSANAIGSLYMTAGSLAYVLNDALIRVATEEGLDVYQALSFRALTMAVLFAAVGRARGEQLVMSHLRAPVLWRVAAELLATALFFGALVRLDFANAQAILQIVPFAVTLAAAVLLKERVSARQYVTILIGFVGVLIIVRPATDGFSVWSLAVVGSAVILVVREFATRRVDPEIPALSIAFLTAVSLAVLTGTISLFTGWGDLTARAVNAIGAASVCLFAGYLFTIQTVRVGDLSVSAPFRYTVLVGAVVFGFLFFGEVPDGPTIVGSVIIVTTGFYAVYLERGSSGIQDVQPAV